MINSAAEFSYGCDPVEVTSLHRPDTGWRVVDAKGHEHRWYDSGRESRCEACEAGYRLVADGIHYDDARGGWTWGLCRKLTPFPATNYNAVHDYVTPTLLWVKDGEEFWEDDDEPHDVGHLECRQCGEHVSPGYTADTYRVYIPGLRWYRINGESVSEQDFERRLAEARHDPTNEAAS